MNTKVSAAILAIVLATTLGLGITEVSAIHGGGFHHFHGWHHGWNNFGCWGWNAWNNPWCHSSFNSLWF